MSVCIDCGRHSPLDVFQLCCGARLCNSCGPPQETCPHCKEPPRDWNNSTILYNAYKNLAAKGDQGAANKFELLAIRLLQETPDNRMLRRDIKRYGKNIRYLQEQKGLSFQQALSHLNQAYNKACSSDRSLTQVNESLRHDNPASKVCAECTNDSASRFCSCCQVTVYCNRECQIKHWKKHKAVCRQLCKRRENEST